MSRSENGRHTKLTGTSDLPVQRRVEVLSLEMSLDGLLNKLIIKVRGQLMPALADLLLR